jgi:hypothetical protein
MLRDPAAPRRAPAGCSGTPPRRAEPQPGARGTRRAAQSPSRMLAAPAAARRLKPAASLLMPRHTLLNSPGPGARRYDVDAAFMQLELHGCGIHAL